MLVSAARLDGLAMEEEERGGEEGEEEKEVHKEEHEKGGVERNGRGERLGDREGKGGRWR